jgi:hypothetical protein
MVSAIETGLQIQPYAQHDLDAAAPCQSRCCKAVTLLAAHLGGAIPATRTETVRLLTISDYLETPSGPGKPAGRVIFTGVPFLSAGSSETGTGSKDGRGTRSTTTLGHDPPGTKAAVSQYSSSHWPEPKSTPAMYALEPVCTKSIILTDSPPISYTAPTRKVKSVTQAHTCCSCGVSGGSGPEGVPTGCGTGGSGEGEYAIAPKSLVSA